MTQARTCLYCDKVGKLSREHIIPEALGGVPWRRSVCEKCNNEVLSELDKELTARSPLSLVAAQELHKRTGYSWDVDHADGNLLMEARADVATNSMTLWPQIIFDRDGAQLRADAQEIHEFRPENFQAVLVRHLLSAFHSLPSAKRPRLIFERMRSKIPPLYRFPPRVFAARRIRDFDSRMHFQCRYQYEGDKRRVLKELADWDSSRPLETVKLCRGSTLPAVHTTYDPRAVVRSLMKLAINLLCLACTRTAVDRAHFGDVIRLITGELPFPLRMLSQSGFVYAEDVRVLHCPADSHKFRLIHDQGVWRVSAAFFGGAVGAYVQFPGPSRETWRAKDITAPIGCRDWAVRESAIVLPMTVRIEWRDFGKILPSMPFVNTTSTVTVTRVRD